VRFGPNVVEQIGRVYRNLRNRIRFMLSNLYDLRVDDVALPETMQPIDRLACGVTEAFVGEMKRAYECFDLHDAYLRVVEFESAMSSLYFDALKDPMYSRAANDPRRRSAQSALFYVLTRLLTAVAPVLSFTAEEAWQALPESLRGNTESIFDSSFQTAHVKHETLADDMELWETLRQLRSRVAASETPRDFEAQVRLRVNPALHRQLSALGDNLREALVVSRLELLEVASDAGEPDLEILPADGEKCERCWKFRELGVDPAYPIICADCAAVVRGLKT
jgi:isoleucyl-tRNA synthetase